VLTTSLNLRRKKKVDAEKTETEISKTAEKSEKKVEETSKKSEKIGVLKKIALELKKAEVVKTLASKKEKTAEKALKVDKTEKKVEKVEKTEKKVEDAAQMNEKVSAIEQKSTTSIKDAAQLDEEVAEATAELTNVSNLKDAAIQDASSAEINPSVLIELDSSIPLSPESQLSSKSLLEKRIRHLQQKSSIRPRNMD